MLDGLLSFCKQDRTGTENEDLVLPSVELEKSMHELAARELITKDGRVLSIHRMIQEAVNYHDVEDLQESFNTASRLVNEQFPQLHMESFGNQWNICQEYIPHAIYLSKYSEYAASLVSKGAPMVLSADDTLVTLLSNCAWYVSPESNSTMLNINQGIFTRSETMKCVDVWLLQPSELAKTRPPYFTRNCWI